MSRDKNDNVPNYPNESLTIYTRQYWQNKYSLLIFFFCCSLFKFDNLWFQVNFFANICLFVCLFLNSFEMSFKYFDTDKKPHSFNEDFQSTLYPLVKYYFAAFYQDNLLPSILAACINIFLFPTHKCIISKKGKSFGQRLYAYGCQHFP